MKTIQSWISGAVGACTLTLLHEVARRTIPDAPRVDVLGSEAISKGLRLAGQRPPAGEKLHHMALAGDLASNTCYYSLVGTGEDKGVWLRGAILGLVAGLGAVFLPGPMGLNAAPSNRTPATRVMTVAWYLVGGLAAAATARCMATTVQEAESE